MKSIKKMIYLKLFFSIPLCLTLFGSSCSKSEDNNSIEDNENVIEEEEAKYDVLNLKEIPIGLWVTPPSTHQTNEEYKKIKEVGINFVNGFPFYENSLSKILNVLDFCQNNNLKYFAYKSIVANDISKYATSSDPALLKKFTNEIKPYADHPAFIGELLMDEPGKNLFNSIAAFTNEFEKSYPDKLWHVNLFPTYATGGIRTTSYEDYISSWIQQTSPKHISYDNYPLLTDGSIIDDYYYNLDIVRAKSRLKKIPFWTFIQTLSIAGTPGTPNKREPSEADIRWQVWSSLAFGSKGIQYFCYWTPGSGSEQFGNALIGLNGEKTVRYNYVKKLNEDINEIGKILLNCHAEGVIQTASKSYSLYDPLYDFKEIEKVTGGDNIIGCFQSVKGERKILITTLTPDKDADINLQLNKEIKKVRVWENSSHQDITVQDNTLSFNIKAGDAVFIEFEK